MLFIDLNIELNSNHKKVFYTIKITFKSYILYLIYIKQIKY